MNLTRDNYHSDEANAAYFNKSQVCAFMDCPASWKAQYIDHTYTRPTTPALLRGTLFEAMLTEPDEAVRIMAANECNVFSHTKKTHDAAWMLRQARVLMRRVARVKRTRDIRAIANAAVRALQPPDNTPGPHNRAKLRAGFDNIPAMVEAVRRNQLAMDLLPGERQRIVTGTVGGQPFRGMVDIVSECHVLTDIKTTRSIDCEEWRPEYSPDMSPPWPVGWWSGGRAPWWVLYRYHYQAALYRELWRQTIEETWPFRLLAVDDNRDPVCRVYEFDTATLHMNRALSEIEWAAGEMVAIRDGRAEPQRCGVCRYCRQSDAQAEVVMI